MSRLRVLLLGGTAEARALAEQLAGDDDFDAVSSLAGRVRDLRLPDGEIHIGGFGGVQGLRDYLRDNAVDAVVDATHPYARKMTANAVAAAGSVPLVVLNRPPWRDSPGDTWIRAESITDAAMRIRGLGERVLLTIGRQGVHLFADVTEAWFLIRAIDPPTGRLPPRHELLLRRGPFTVAEETELIRQHRIDVLITKNSGGDQTVAKLQAARRLGVATIVVDRPPLPGGVATVESVDGALDWLRNLRAFDVENAAPASSQQQERPRGARARKESP